MIRSSIFIVVALFCFGCGSSSSYTSSGADQSLRSKVVRSAKKEIGDPYKYAAKGPNKFDCSGLVHYVYGQNGMSAKGSSSHMSEQGKKVELKRAQPGDLIFFKRKGRVFHVSIITKNSGGELWVVHSTSSKGVIQQDIMKSNYWKPLIHKVVSLSSFRN